MKIYGGETLSEPQINAGLNAMNGPNGQFSGFKVMSALRRAGVTNIVSGAEVLIGRELRGATIGGLLGATMSASRNRAAVVASAALLVSIPAQADTSATKPHIHYEIIVSHSALDEPTPAVRLRRACELSKAITKRTEPRSDAILSLDLAALRLATCGKSN